MGVVRMYVWLVGVVVRRYMDILIITYPYSTCNIRSSFLQHQP